MSGTVVDTGERVSGMTGMRLGGHAELVAVRADRLVPTPEGAAATDAAAVLFGGATALHFLGERVRPGTTVLVNGASGAVGSSAVQVARLLGGEVTAVTAAPVLLEKLGAHHVVDRRVQPVASLDERYDVVVDTVGNLSRAQGLALTTSDGVLVQVIADLLDTLRARGRVVAGTSSEDPAHFTRLLGWLAAGDLDPVVDVVGGLDALPEAYRRVDSGRKVGNLVVVP